MGFGVGNLWHEGLGGDPLMQETIRLWDSGVRLEPTGQPVYLGQVASEVLVQRMKVFSYWSAVPASRASLEQLAEEAGDLQIRWGSDSLLLLRDSRTPESSTGSPVLQ